MKNKITSIVVLLLSVFFTASAQQFKNGSFENNNASSCLLGVSYQSFNSSVSDINQFVTNGSGASILSANYCNQYISNIPDGNWCAAVGSRAMGISQGLAFSLTNGLNALNHYCISLNYQSDSTFTFPAGYTNLLIGLSNDSTQFGVPIKRISAIARTWALDTIDFVAPANYKYVTVKSDSTKVGTYFIDNFKFISEPATGVDEVSETKISIYPNPANDFVNIESFEPIKTVQIYSTDGRLLQSNSFAGEMICKLSLANLQSGIYLSKINNQNSFNKIIVAK